MAKFELGTESEIAHYYNDDETLRLVNAMANVIGGCWCTVLRIPIEEVWEAYGGFLIQFTMETGWDELLRAMAPDLEGFLDSLDSLHYFIDHVVYKTKLRGPSFRCDVQADGTLLLHYYSKRSGLYPIVKGVVREVARRIYDTEVVMKVQERKQEHLDAFVTEHVVFVITQIENSNSVQKAISSKTDSQIDLTQ
uniref:HNOB domain-containing protein n=1 Tax=Caenorhabditis japonica TaxID=281687 RepID=A0A8R1EF61_CAEJA